MALKQCLAWCTEMEAEKRPSADMLASVSRKMNNPLYFRSLLTRYATERAGSVGMQPFGHVHPFAAG